MPVAICWMCAITRFLLRSKAKVPVFADSPPWNLKCLHQAVLVANEVQIGWMLVVRYVFSARSEQQ